MTNALLRTKSDFIFETLLPNGYPKEWLALYLQGVNGAAVGNGTEGRLLNCRWRRWLGVLGIICRLLLELLSVALLCFRHLIAGYVNH